GKTLTDSMFDGVLNERLNHERRNLDATQFPGNVDVYLKPVLETGSLDIQIGFNQIHFVAKRYEFFTCPQDTAHQPRQAHECSQSTLRGCLDQVTNCRESIE